MTTQLLASIDRTKTAADDSRHRRAIGFSLLGLLAYVPLLVTATGRVVIDSKEFLSLDPGHFLARAPYLWNPNLALGTTTHQDLGYLFPAGPFAWLTRQTGLPVWVTQRLWLGSLLFAAGLGVLYLMRTLRVHGPGVVIAALVYMLSPYFLQYGSRISVILIAWSAMPWLVALIARALREDSWRYIAAFAVVVQVAGSVNPPSLFFAGLAPLLWVVHAVVSRECSFRHALKVCARIALLTVLASLWWLVSFVVQGTYGLDVLRYSESIEAVAITGHSGEVLRGLGYWLFYLGDRLGPSTEASVDYARRILIVTGYAIPVLALVSAAFIRWRHRAYFVLLILVGVVVAVGTHPYDDPSPFGAAVKEFGEGSTVGLGLRSVGRAVPLAVLGVAVLLGIGVNLLARRLADRGRPRLAFAACALVALLVAVNIPSLWTGEVYGENVQRGENIPSYWTEAIEALDARPHDTRIFEIPGMDAGVYRWADTNVPITPGLTDRPYVARELIPYGSAAAADLLHALDRRVQRGSLDPDALVSIAALMSVGDIVVRSDLQTDQFDLARPREVWAIFESPPDGLEAAGEFDGDVEPLELEQLDARELAIPDDTPEPPAVAVFSLRSTRDIVRAQPGTSVVLVSGDGDGLVDLAQAGILPDSPTLLYSGSLAGDPDAIERELRRGAAVVVTDTNRSRPQHWSELDVLGYTERTDEQPLVEDREDQRLEVFPDAGADAFTYMEQHGARVSASGYGTRTAFVPSNRPARALDGDPDTAWVVGAYGPVIGERIRIEPDQPLTADRMNLVQPLTGRRDRHITRVELRFADTSGDAVGAPVQVDLGPESRTADGQTVRFDRRRFASIEIAVLADGVGEQLSYDNDSGVGFAEIRIPDESGEDLRVDEIVRMPSDLVNQVRGIGTDTPLVFEMTRLRSLLVGQVTSDEETALVRDFRVPAARSFGVSGTVRLSAVAPDEVVDEAIGLPSAADGGITARSSGHLRTDVSARASSAIDGDPATEWTADANAPSTGQWIELELAAPNTFDHLDLRIVSDGRHSVPARAVLDVDGVSREISLPEIADLSERGASTVVPVTFEPVTGQRVRLTIESVRAVETVDYESGRVTALPVAIAELGIPGVAVAKPDLVSTECRDDLVEIDGEPISVRASGLLSDQAQPELELTRCDLAAGDRPEVSLSRGRHALRTAPGAQTGFDIDGIVLASGAGNTPIADGRGVHDELIADRFSAPGVGVVHSGRTKIEVNVSDAREPFWLVLGQSANHGWHAEIDGRDLGAPQLVDGFANGWRVDPDANDFMVTLTWKPQRLVWIGITISAIVLLGCVLLVLRPRARTTVESGAEPPVAVNPFTADGDAVSPLRALGTSLTCGLGAAVLTSPWVGLVAAGAAFMVARDGRWRALLSIGAPLALACTGLYVVVQQSRHNYQPGLEWPSRFDDVHVIGLLAVVLLATDIVVELVRRPRERANLPPS